MPDLIRRRKYSDEPYFLRDKTSRDQFFPSAAVKQEGSDEDQPIEVLFFINEMILKNTICIERATQFKHVIMNFGMKINFDIM